jgi:hypothetical protein
MFRTLRNLIATALFTGAVGAAVKFLYVDRLTPEQRAMWQGRIDAAVSAGKEAAADRRLALERRLDELVAPPHNDN